MSNPRWRTMNSLLWIFLEDFRSVQTSRQLTEFYYNQFSFLATSTNKRRSIMRSNSISAAILHSRSSNEDDVAVILL